MSSKSGSTSTSLTSVDAEQLQDGAGASTSQLAAPGGSIRAGKKFVWSDHDTEKLVDQLYANAKLQIALLPGHVTRDQEKGQKLSKSAVYDMLGRLVFSPRPRSSAVSTLAERVRNRLIWLSKTYEKEKNKLSEASAGMHWSRVAPGSQDYHVRKEIGKRHAWFEKWHTMVLERKDTTSCKISPPAPNMRGEDAGSNENDDANDNTCPSIYGSLTALDVLQVPCSVEMQDTRAADGHGRGRPHLDSGTSQSDPSLARMSFDASIRATKAQPPSSPTPSPTPAPVLPLTQNGRRRQYSSTTIEFEDDYSFTDLPSSARGKRPCLQREKSSDANASAVVRATRSGTTAAKDKTQDSLLVKQLELQEKKNEARIKVEEMRAKTERARNRLENRKLEIEEKRLEEQSKSREAHLKLMADTVQLIAQLVQQQQKYTDALYCATPSTKTTDGPSNRL
ncbi:hypothetical protein BCV70DRAFT_219494 [Testicularia cyperi]|uniref:Uncharacterized protein n=1 Tax=Testicularia cyperi TaxID=1882483 RepID=A0A317XGC0_9BASI|nr:hypothetical protein BCV70DRAFT_219494 [Testicularia cyperi]